MHRQQSKVKNIILLTIDSLRYDRLENRTFSVAPTIKWIENKGISCSRAFTCGPPTQFAFPPIFTSTMPLDFEGYDNGIKNRPITLAEILKVNGYSTVGFSISPWLGRFYGYDRGFDDFYELFDIKLFWDNFKNIYYSYFKILKEEGTISDIEMINIIKPLTQKIISYLVFICDQRKTGLLMEMDKEHCLHRYNYSVIRKELKKHLRVLQKKEYFESLNYFRKNMSMDFYHFSGITSKVKASIFYDFVFRIATKLLSKIFIDIRHPNVIKADCLKDNIISWINENRAKPFFIWSHFLDIHSANYTSNKRIFPLDFIKIFFDSILWNKNKTDLLYNFSLKCIDEEIRQLINFLKQKNIFNETLIVLCGDHGGTYKKMKSRIYPGSFYEEAIRIPMLFYNPTLKTIKLDNLCSIVDIAPTILNLAGIDDIPEFKGSPVYSTEAKGREYVLLENLGTGPCDLERKPINICVRNKRYKYIWQETKNSNMKQSELNKLYDLEEDPFEEKDLIGHTKYKTIVYHLENIAIDRCRAIRNTLGHYEPN